MFFNSVKEITVLNVFELDACRTLKFVYIFSSDLKPANVYRTLCTAVIRRQDAKASPTLQPSNFISRPVGLI